jgi:hypothetical protein
MEQEMENRQQRGGTSLMLPATPGKRWKPDDNPFEECKSLVKVLAKKTETLCRECRSDKDKATHIRTMGLTLATLTDLVNRLDHDSRTRSTPEIIVDAHGFTYQSVRSCDLDRISDK